MIKCLVSTYRDRYTHSHAKHAVLCRETVPLRMSSQREHRNCLDIIIFKICQGSTWHHFHLTSCSPRTIHYILLHGVLWCFPYRNVKLPEDRTRLRKFAVRCSNPKGHSFIPICPEGLSYIIPFLSVHMLALMRSSTYKASIAPRCWVGSFA